MLANLVKIEERVLQSSADSCHSTQCSTLELFALEERLSIFKETDIISRHNFDKMLCRRQLAKGDLEVIFIVKGIEEIVVEWVDILHSRKSIQNQRYLLREGLLGELDLSGVKI